MAAGMPGASWLELLMLFDMAGGGTRMTTAKLGSQRAQSTKRRLSTFKSITNLVIKTTATINQANLSWRPQPLLIGLCTLVFWQGAHAAVPTNRGGGPSQAARARPAYPQVSHYPSHAHPTQQRQSVRQTSTYLSKGHTLLEQSASKRNLR